MNSKKKTGNHRAGRVITAMIKVLTAANKPITAEQILERLPRPADRATVYRNVKSLSELGKLRKINLRTGVSLYELANSHHHHLVCHDCGRVEDFATCDIERLSKKIVAQSRTFRVIDDHALELFGRCRQCV